MSTYAIVRNDDTVSIMQLLESSDPHAEIAKWPEEDQKTVARVFEVQVDTLPFSRTFRNAWRFKDGKITIDLEAAKQLKMQTIRNIRDEQLRALDRVFMFAIERNDSNALLQIRNRKQELRNLPDTDVFAGISDLDELENFLPAILTGENFANFVKGGTSYEEERL